MSSPAFWQPVYTYLISPLLTFGLRLAAVKNEKIRETLKGHEGQWERMQDQMRIRDNTNRLVWFHVASAGEYLQALPVMERLMSAGYQCALTITSVSGYRWAKKRKKNYPNLIMLDYLPLDKKSNINRLLDLINPTAVVYVKFDLWPNLVWETKKRNIPQILISATLQEKSLRVTSRLGRKFYSSIYNSLDLILAVTREDENRFKTSSNTHIETAGDTRFDSVLDRKKLLSPPDLPEYIKDKTILLLGSIWPADEQHIFPEIEKALFNNEELLVIAAPHETHESHIKDIEKTFSAFSPVRYTNTTALESKDSRFIIIDTVGILSSLYYYADVAYVGGAFSTGVHNTMEPASMSVPAIFGPFFQNSPEAMVMVEEEKCFSIKNGDQFKSILNKLLENESYRQDVGLAASQFIDDQAGASDICFNKIKEYLA